VLSVGCCVNGSIMAVVGSGIISISLLCIACQPRILEPSNPNPSSNDDNSSADIGTETCCQRPGKSMNLRSNITALFFFANSNTSRGVILLLLLLLYGLFY